MMGSSQGFKRVVTAAVLLTGLSASGCGYFMHPERVGQTGGRLDPAIVALDALGLLVGVVPGIIAFAVDITTGAIYLAPGEESVIEKHQKRVSLNDFSNDVPSGFHEVSPLDMPENLESIAKEIDALTLQPITAADIKFYRASHQQQLVLLEKNHFTAKVMR